MPLIRYNGLSVTGARLTGEIEAPSAAAAVLALQQAGHYPVRAVPAPRVTATFYLSPETVARLIYIFPSPCEAAPWPASPASSSPAFRTPSPSAATGGSRPSSCRRTVRASLELLAAAARAAETAAWAYCLMPNPVRPILVPTGPDGLRATLGDLRRRYTARIHARHRWTGYLWQGRFGSVARDEPPLMAAARSLSLDPVRARLVARAEDWPRSSVRAPLAGRDDGVTGVAPLFERIGDVAAFLAEPVDKAATDAPLRRAETTGRPTGEEPWLRQLEQRLHRPLLPRRRGPKPKGSAGQAQGELFGKLSA